MSRMEAIHIDGVVAAFTIGIVVFCALFAGLVSALTLRDRQLLASLHESSRSTALARRGRRCGAYCLRWKWDSRWHCLSARTFC